MISNIIMALIVGWALVYSAVKVREFFAQAKSGKNMQCSCAGCPGGCKTIRK
ncbi:MAG: hypothetical protein AB7E96_02800 [Deferribacterales bacterium]